MKPFSQLGEGEAFGASHRCDPYRSIYYAAVSGDFNAIHLDPEVGRRAGLPGTVLHGMCTFSWLAQACVRWLDDPARLAAVSARFARPVLPGDEVRIEGRCVRATPERVELALTARNQRGEEVLKSALAQGRPAPDRDAAPAQPFPAPPPAPDGRLAGAVGRRFGPFRYVAGLEEMRDFAVTVAGGVPGRVLAGAAPDQAHPLCVDEEAARAGPHGALVAFPTYCVRFALQPFAAACADPALGLDLARVLHGEQAFVFGAPVRPGDALTTWGELVDARRKKGMEVFTLDGVTTGEGGALVAASRITAVVRD